MGGFDRQRPLLLRGVRGPRGVGGGRAGRRAAASRASLPGRLANAQCGQRHGWRAPHPRTQSRIPDRDALRPLTGRPRHAGGPGRRAETRRRMTTPRLWQAGSPRSLAFGSTPRRVLVLYQHTAPGPMRSALRQKVRVLEASGTHHEIVYWNAGYSVPRAIRRLTVDAVILDATLLQARWAPVFAARRPTFDWLADVGALKIAFPQDEYDHAHVLDDWLADLGVDVVFSVFGAEHRGLLYPRLGATARFEKCLTGYVDEVGVTRHAAVVLPHDRRSLDVAYRAKALTPRFGRLGQLKQTV